MAAFITIFKLLHTPNKLFLPLGKRGYLRWLPDRWYLKLIYYCETGKFLDLKNPKLYTEKLQWLKMFDRNSVYPELVDKFTARNYVKEKIGDNILIDLIGCFDSAEQINFRNLPNKFVLKTTHGSKWNIMCFDKLKLDIKSTKKN